MRYIMSFSLTLPAILLSQYEDDRDALAEVHATIASVEALCDSDPFYAAVLTSWTDASTKFLALSRKERASADPALSLRHYALVGLLDAGDGVAYVKAHPTAAKPTVKGTGLPDYHKALWLAFITPHAQTLRDTYDRCLGPDRAAFMKTCEGLPANVTSFESYIRLGQKGMGNWFVPSPSPVDGTVQVNGKDVVYGLATGFRNDVYRDEVIAAKAAKDAAAKAAKDAAAAEATAKLRAMADAAAAAGVAAADAAMAPADGM